MTADLGLRCNCGAFEAVAKDIGPRAGNHAVCYCDDCQAFQHYLGQPERVLDANGGTGIFQMSLGRLSIVEGARHLACVRLSPKGLLRWYASCCNSAIGNTLATPVVPFIGVITTGFARANGGDVLHAALGRRQRGVFGRYAYGDRRTVDAHDTYSLWSVFRFVGLVMRWRVQGAHKRSPFFDSKTGRPRVSATVLDEAARDRIERQRLAFIERTR